MKILNFQFKVSKSFSNFWRKLSTKALRSSNKQTHFPQPHLCTTLKHIHLNWSTWTNEHSQTQINFYFNLFCDYSSRERKTVCLSIKTPVLFNFCQCSNAFSMNPLMGFLSWNSNSPNHSTNFQFRKAFVKREKEIPLLLLLSFLSVRRQRSLKI